MKKYYLKPDVHTVTILLSSLIAQSIQDIDGGDTGIGFSGYGEDEPARSHEHSFMDDFSDNYPSAKEPWSNEE